MNRLRLRVRYLLRRARAIEVPRVWGMARSMAPAAHRPTLWVFLDMLWASVRHETGFQDYQDWDFYMLTSAERRTFITHPASDHLVLMFNQKEFRGQFADKARFNQTFPDMIGREWIDLRVASFETVREFVAANPVMILKPADSLGGKDVQKVTREQISDVETFVADAVAARQVLLEQFLVQHPEMQRLNPSSVNTLRMVTFVTDDQVDILACVLKIGNGGDVDNFSDGGMYTMLGDDGIALYPAFDGRNDVYSVHPGSGVTIPGFAVPLFDQVCDLVRAAALRVPQLRYVGWDVAITPERPVLIEGNYNTGVFQAKPSASGVRRGLRPRYYEAMGLPVSNR
ncbi:hypothetical protein GCM10009808_07660 [Microbacterium sediminicola]|uniref:Alpha-L-glutamate ligase-related protein ATP-grasp domain-containing protein n=1 Tax=Microbacterium sediminicola TaxID=415210 RepID=A0ABN2HSS5_9MICO